MLLVCREGMRTLNATCPFAVVDHHFRGSCVLLRVLREAVCWSCCGAFGGMFSWRPSSNPYPEPSRRSHRLHSLSVLASGVYNTIQHVSSGVCFIGAMVGPSAVDVKPSMPSKGLRPPTPTLHHWMQSLDASHIVMVSTSESPTMWWGSSRMEQPLLSPRIRLHPQTFGIRTSTSS
jgi:hypothetical protein